MVGSLPAGLSSDVTSYRGNAFEYENAIPQAGLLPGFANITGGWCTGEEVGELRRLPARPQGTWFDLLMIGLIICI